MMSMVVVASELSGWVVVAVVMPNELSWVGVWVSEWLSEWSLVVVAKVMIAKYAEWVSEWEVDVVMTMMVTVTSVLSEWVVAVPNTLSACHPHFDCSLVSIRKGKWDSRVHPPTNWFHHTSIEHCLPVVTASASHSHDLMGRDVFVTTSDCTRCYDIVNGRACEHKCVVSVR